MKLFLLLLFFNFGLWAQESEQKFQLSFGNVDIGESRIPINLSDFSIISKNSLNLKTKVEFIKDSVQWIRMSNNLLSPRARLGIQIESSDSNIHLNYSGKSIVLTRHQNILYTQLYVSLFNPMPIEVIVDGKKVGRITIRARSPERKTETKLIDYSCSNYNVQIQGVDDEYISVGCRMDRLGRIGKERPRLEVSWSATNFHLLDQSPPPYVSIFTRNDPAKVMVEDEEGNKKEITITADIPERLHRLKTAFGLGPYAFNATEQGKKRDTVIAPSFMLYGNFYLMPGASVRMFDALVWQDSIFNNFGFYFAYDVAKIFDQRILIVPLLGVQGLTFKYNKNSPSFTRMIYPQGAEVVINHAFGITGYSVVYGMFFSTSSAVDYMNLWLRWGKKVFWEINYIDWGDDGHEATMYGLSVGIPLGSFF